MNFVMQIARKLNLIPVPFVDTLLSMNVARCLIEATRLGLFTTIENTRRGLTSSEVAQVLEISLDGAEVLIKALHGMGYLSHRNGYYKNGRWVKRWITDPNQGIQNAIIFQNHGWLRLSDLEQTLKTGHPAQDYNKKVAVPSKGQNVYTSAMYEMARMQVPRLLKKVRLSKGAKRLLDIGGGHGYYSRALMKKYSGLQATVLDFAGPISMAKELHAREVNQEGMEFRIGNALTDDLGSNWDVVLLVNIIHLFKSDQNRELLQRVHATLNPQGVVIIVDQFLGLGKMQDKIASIMSLSYFTAGGKIYHVVEMARLLEEAGFQGIEKKHFSFSSISAIFQSCKEA